MKALVVGAKGIIGRQVAASLPEQYDVLTAGRNSGDVRVDITNIQSVQQMFQQTGNIDALVCTAGEAKWDSFREMTDDDFFIGLNSKLMGQVRLVREGFKYINPGGSITLTTGVLADKPVLYTSSAAMVNGAIHSFVKAVSLELDNIRINVVSSGLVEDSVQKYGSFFPGHKAVPMKRVVDAYLLSVEGRMHGEVIRVYD